MLSTTLLDSLLLFVATPRHPEFTRLGRVRMDKDGGADLTFFEATDGIALLQLIVSAPDLSELEGTHFIEYDDLAKTARGRSKKLRLARDREFPDTSVLFANGEQQEMDISVLWPQLHRLHALGELLGAEDGLRFDLIRTPRGALQVTLYPPNPAKAEWVSAVVVIAPVAR